MHKRLLALALLISFTAADVVAEARYGGGRRGFTNSSRAGRYGARDSRNMLRPAMPRRRCSP